MIPLLLLCIVALAQPDTPTVQHFPRGNATSIDSFRGSMEIDKSLYLGKIPNMKGVAVLTTGWRGYVDTVAIGMLFRAGHGLELTGNTFSVDTSAMVTISKLGDTLNSYVPILNIVDFGATPSAATEGVQAAINYLQGVVENFDTLTGNVVLDSVRPAMAGKIYTPEGEWNLERRLIKNVTHPTTGTKFVNSQIYIPLISDIDESKSPNQIEFFGVSQPTYLVNYLNARWWALPVKQSILHSTIYNDSSAYPAVVRAVPGDSIYPFAIPISLNPTEWHMRDMGIRVHHDTARGGTQLCGLDFYNTANHTTKNLNIDVDFDNFWTASPAFRVFALRTAATGTGNTQIHDNNVYQGGFWYNVVAGEHTILRNNIFSISKIAVEFMTAGYPVDFQNCLIIGTKTALSASNTFTIHPTNTATVVTGTLRIEDARVSPAGKWYLSNGVFDIDDPLNTLRGELWVEYSIDGTPAPKSIRFNGGKNLQVSTPTKHSSDSVLQTGFKTVYMPNLGIEFVSRQTYGGISSVSNNALGEGYVVAAGDRDGEFTNTVAAFIAMSTKSRSNTGKRFSGKGADWSFLFTYGSLSQGLAIGTNNAKPLVLGTTDLERARITEAGDFGLGTTTPLTFLAHTMSARRVMHIVDSVNYAGFYAQGKLGALFSLGHIDGPANQKYFQFFNSGGLVSLLAVADNGLSVMANVQTYSLSTGNTSFGIGTAGTSKVDITGATGYQQLRLRTTYTPTGTADGNGQTGDIAVDDNYIYRKTSTGWKRSAIFSTF